MAVGECLTQPQVWVWLSLLYQEHSTLSVGKEATEI